MEHELGFPNPVERHDLPKKRKRWPKIVLAIVVPVALIVFFLPQLMRLGPGKRLLCSYLESKYRKQFWIEDIRTSWWGGTEIKMLVMRDTNGDRLKVFRLSCDASLWQLLNGDFALGPNAKADGVFLDYVVDYGNGQDLFDSMKKPPKPGQKAPSPEPEIWPLTGKIEITNSALNLTRGQVMPSKGYRVDYHALKFTDINGTLEIGQDGTWSGDFTAAITPAGESPPGKARISGKLKLGPEARFGDKGSSGTLKLEAKDVPAGLAGWVVDSSLLPEEYTEILGPVLRSVDMDMRLAEGKLHFDTLRATGTRSAMRMPEVEGKPVIDFASTPTMLSQGAEPLRFGVNMTRALAREHLGLIQPFLLNTESGWAQITLSEVALPMGKTPAKPAVRGVLQTSALKLVVDGDWWQGFEPKSLLGQWGQLVNLEPERMAAELPTVAFELEYQWVKPEPVHMIIAGKSLAVEGSVGPGRKLKMTVTVPEVPRLGKSLKIPLVGTISEPRLTFEQCELSPDETKALRHLLEDHLHQQGSRHRQRQLEDRSAPK